jgi:hypothetical protein
VYVDREGLQVDTDRGAERFAVAYVEAALVQGHLEQPYIKDILTIFKIEA